ncbi:hypothetical protein QYY51_07770 [Enterobacter hormaechei]|uniref:hypothetical protein n=1 Tax=Enterobacter cloacae complex TaxID=354276 RepID=UPI00263A4B39|nr:MULTISPECIES: hypothetical protein [Enterobacter cloacae complex]MDN4964047.1 hypothetical protein [Enterobacter hormaechei]MDO6155609.1 hypothetical protein [Enterobacter hormaechei]MEA5215277.1 hypothetical protein [Enterobacter cloacae]
MGLLFTTITHAVTPDGELVDVHYSGNELLVCEFCDVPLKLMVYQDGTKKYEHDLSNFRLIELAHRCKYRHYPQAITQPYDDLKKSAMTLSITLWAPRKLMHLTVTQRWQCMLCGKRYLGNKQCPRRNDWTSTIPETALEKST